MYSIIWKNLNLTCFSKFKCLPPTPPSQGHRHRHSHTSSPPHHDTLLTKSFNNSAYDLTSPSTSSSAAEDLFSSSSEHDTTPPDFSTLFASRRFFFSSPGRSNSIVESSPPPPPHEKLLDGGVAVPTYSPDPYMDFRRSMQEMVEAREALGLTSDWEYLHQLLLCYLTLNPQNTHNIIVRAFSDLLVTLLSSDDEQDPRRQALGPASVLDSVKRMFQGSMNDKGYHKPKESVGLCCLHVPVNCYIILIMLCVL